MWRIQLPALRMRNTRLTVAGSSGSWGKRHARVERPQPYAERGHQDSEEDSAARRQVPGLQCVFERGAMRSVSRRAHGAV